MNKVVSTLAVVLVLVLAGCTQADGGKPSDVVRAAAEATAALDFGGYNSYITEDLQSQSIGFRDVFNQLKQSGIQMRLSNFIVTEESISGNTAMVRFDYELTATYQGSVRNSGLKSSEATLVKENGVWKINGPVGVFEPNAGPSEEDIDRYSGETRSCPSDFQILAATLAVTDAGAGTGTLSMVLANSAGHKITMNNMTLGGDVTGALTAGSGDVNAGDSRTVTSSVDSGLTGSAGTLVNINAQLAFTHSATGFNNLAGSTTCNLKMKIP